MFTQFFAAIHLAWAVDQISARHRLEPPKEIAYHHPLEQTLFDALHSSSSGVFVHWGVYESGKTTAVQHAAWRLQEEAGRQVICMHGYDYGWHKTMSAWLRWAIGVPEDMADKPLKDFFTKPDTTLVLDHFDLLMREKDNRDVDVLELVRTLVKDSETTKKFNVLLVVTSWERAKELVAAGCKLVPNDAPARWTREQLEILYETFTDEVKEKVGERKYELLLVSRLSGTPGTLKYGVRELEFPGKIQAGYAVMHDLEWRMGTKALYLEPDSEIQTKARFPDRNGIFHHKDVLPLTGKDVLAIQVGTCAQ